LLNISVKELTKFINCVYTGLHIAWSNCLYVGHNCELYKTAELIEMAFVEQPCFGQGPKFPSDLEFWSRTLAQPLRN